MTSFLPKEHVQGSPEWETLRSKYIGASDAPIIMGVSPWKTPLQLWEEKVGIADHTQKTQALLRGVDLESYARESFERIVKMDVFPQVIYHPHNNYMMASLDGLSLDGKCAVEIKCPGAKSHAIALEGKIPDIYIPQLQHQLACLELESMWYYSFDGEDGVAIKVARDDEYIKRLMEREKEFWDRVQNFSPPNPTNKDYETKDCPKWAALGARLSEIEESLKLLEAEKKSIRQELISDANGRSCRGANVTLTRSFAKGRVNYNSIPELNNVDLDQYRGKTEERWTLRVK